MRLVASLTVVAVFLLLGIASAAGPVQVEIIAIEEKPGQVVATIGAYGPDGKALTNLTAANFSAALEGTPLAVVDVQNASVTRASASVVLMVDVSGSMQGEPMNQAKRALQEFLRALDPADQVAILAFDTTVVQLQDFTTDRRLLEQAVLRLTPRGNTALYDAVIQATAKASEAQGRRLIVLLSDGEATAGLERRDESIAVAQNSGIGIVTVALGNELDRNYLNQIATASGGRLLDAPTPAALRQAYADLAEFIRSQYTLTLQVPPSVDRTVTGKLTLHVTSGADAGQAERMLAPLPGALAPKFDVSVEGFLPGAKLLAPVAVTPHVTEGVTVATVEFMVDGKSVHKATQPPFAFEVDPAKFAGGGHTLKLVVTDDRGRQAVIQLAFLVAVAPGAGIGQMLLFVLAAAAGAAVIGGGVYIVFFWRRGDRVTSVEGRVRPWAVRSTETGPIEGWQVPEPLPPPVAAEEPLGRIVVMNEDALRTGSLDAIREFAIGSAPLTLGTSAACDIRLEDPEGRIGAEEARLWIQKGRLVYHKLTTLSAMATEGVVGGWQLLDDEEDVAVGPYRVLYQADVVEEQESEEEERLPAEETSFFRGLWSADDPPLRPSTD